MLTTHPHTTPEWHDAKVNARRGMTPDGRSLMQYGGDHLWLACVADCAFPVFYVVRADTWEDAYEIAVSDRTVPAHDESDHDCNNDVDCAGYWSDDRGEMVDAEAVMVWGPIDHR